MAHCSLTRAQFHYRFPTAPTNCDNPADAEVAGARCTIVESAGQSNVPVRTLQPCMSNNPINLNVGNQCTANDIRIATIINQSPILSCVVGQVVKITMKANIVSTAQDRYGIGLYVALDGGDARFGQCFGDVLSPVNAQLNDKTLVVDGSSSSTTVDNGPYYNVDGDLCGDAFQDESIWQTMVDVSFICRDSNNDGVADIGTCVSWSNGELGAGSLAENRCHDIYSSLQNTGSKCNCGSTQIVGLTVCLSALPQCIGDDLAQNTFPCESDMSARFKVSSSATSSLLPPSSVLYGNIYLDYDNVESSRFALQYFDPRLMPGANNAAFFAPEPTIIREDIYWPCKTSAYTTCAATGTTTSCSVRYNKNSVPRLFREAMYTINAAKGMLYPDSACGVGTPELGTGAGSVGGELQDAGFTCFKKTAPATATADAIAYVWAKLSSNRYYIGAATTVDGTLWEFYTVSGGVGTRGSYLGVLPAKPGAPVIPIAGNTVYNFDKFDLVSGKQICWCLVLSRPY